MLVRWTISFAETLPVGKQEGATALVGGTHAQLGGDLHGGYHVQPMILEGHEMQVFQEEMFGPVVSATKFTDDEQAAKLKRSGRPVARHAPDHIAHVIRHQQGAAV